MSMIILAIYPAQAAFRQPKNNGMQKKSVFKSVYNEIRA